MPTEHVEMESDFDYDHFFSESARLIADNWCDGFFSRMVFTVGSPYMRIDNTILELEVGSIVVDEQILLPICVINRETGGYLDIEELERSQMESVIIDDQVMMPIDVIDTYLDFEVDWNAVSQEITITRDFQARRLLVLTEAGMDFTNLGATDILERYDHMAILQFASIGEAQEAYDHLSNLEHVVWVEPDMFIPSMLPTDRITEPLRFTPLNAGHRSWGVERAGLDMFAAFLRNNGHNRRVVVAVLDTGVYENHPFLRGRVLAPGRCFVSTNPHNQYDRLGHGTHVAGIIVDSTPGLDVRILPGKVMTGHTETFNSAIASGIRWAAVERSDVDVINMSIQTTYPYRYQAVRHEVEEAIRRNITVIAGAGNNSGNAGDLYPAGIPNVITVAETDHNNNPTIATNFGPSVDIAAPGERIVSSVPFGSLMDNALQGNYHGTGFVPSNGTSMAAPHVAAAAAMLILENPGISPAQVRGALRRNVTVPNTWNSRYGTGILNMQLAIPADPPLFTDIPATHRSFQQIQSIARNGIITGFPEGDFRPAQQLTRAQFSTILGRMYTSSGGRIPYGVNDSFADTRRGSWYAPYVAWASHPDRGPIIQGVGNNNFDPYNNITRAEVATILFRYETFRRGDNEPNFNLNVLDGIAGGANVPGWARPAMAWAVGTGIITYTPLAHQTIVTREAAAVMIHRYMANTAQLSLLGGSASISLNPATNHTFPAATVGYGAQTARTVTVSATGNRATDHLTVTLSGTNRGSFQLNNVAANVHSATIESLSAGRSATFTVVPRTGLAAGTHTATVTVSGANVASQSFVVSFTVNAGGGGTSGISLNPGTNHTFPGVTIPYTAPVARSITVSNTGTQATGNLTIALSGTHANNFTLSTSSLASIPAGNTTRTFTVAPRTGLAAGTHTATVTVSGINLPPQSFTVSFTVTPGGDGSSSISLSQTGHHSFPAVTAPYSRPAGAYDNGT